LASTAVLVDAKSDDASWGEIQNCIFSFNQHAIETMTDKGSVPNVRVNGGMFAIGKNQIGIVNQNGQYVRLEGFKMDILGDSAVGILWKGGTKGVISNIGVELNRNGPATHAILIQTDHAKLANAISDITIHSVNMTSDGTAGSLIDLRGDNPAFPIKGIKIIGAAFSGGTIGIAFHTNPGNNLVSGCSFTGFTSASILIERESHNNGLTDIMADRPSAATGGIIDYSASTVYNGYRWMNGGDFGSEEIRRKTKTNKNK
jgi:hypothetical protein